MAGYFDPTPYLIVNGTNFWAGDAVPTGIGSSAGIQVGDYFHSTSGSVYISSGPVIYICTAVTTTSSTWRQISSTSSSFKTVSATYSLDPVADDTIVMTGASAFNVALPLATAVAVGKTYTVVRAGGANGALTGAINANGTIGSTSAAFGSNPAQIMVRSDGTQWWQIQSTGTVTVT